jgi:hypothetical protein
LRVRETEHFLAQSLQHFRAERNIYCRRNFLVFSRPKAEEDAVQAGIKNVRFFTVSKTIAK